MAFEDAVLEVIDKTSQIEEYLNELTICDINREVI